MNRRSASVLALLAFALAGVTSRAAAAEPARAAPAAVAQAQLLFDEARDLVRRGDVAAACPKFVESHRLDPAGGTILHAADCHQSEGRLATAWTEYNEALSFALRDKRADRERIAREQIGALVSKLGKLVLDVRPAARANEALTVAIDGVLLDRAAWDTPIPLDAGKHVVVTAANGFVPLRIESNVLDHEVTRLAIEPLEAEAKAKKADVTAPPKDEVAPATWSSRKTLALVVGGVGVAGVAVGTIFGIRAASIGDQSARCPSAPGICPPEAVDEQDRARSAATLSTIGFAVGAAGLAAGAIIFFTAPRPANAAVTGFGVRGQTGGATLTLGGTF